MRKNYFFGLTTLVAVVALLFASCAKDFGDDIARVEKDVAALRAELTGKVDTSIKELQASLATTKADLQKEVDNAKKALTDLEAKAATKEDLKKASDDLLAKVVTLEAYNKYVKETKAKIEGIKSDLADLKEKAATKEELKAQIKRIDANVELLNKHDARLKTLEALLDLQKDGSSKVLKDIKADIAGNKASIEALETSVKELKEKVAKNEKDIKELVADLKTQKEALEKLTKRVADNEAAIAKNKEAIDENKGDIAANKTAIENLQAEIERINGEITALHAKDKEIDKRITDLENELNLKISNLASEVRSITFIPTRGLSAEKTMKLYYFAGDYTALHVLKFRVSPSSAKLGKDFAIKGLSYQKTTRADGVKESSELVDLYYIGGATQEGDILSVPVHIKGKAANSVEGNFTWWDNRYFDNIDRQKKDDYGTTGKWGLKMANFPYYVVNTVNRTFKENTSVSGLKLRDEVAQPVKLMVDRLGDRINPSLSFVLNVENLNSGETLRSSEYIHANYIPTQIKLAEKRNGMKARLLKFTQEQAIDWANKPQTTADPDKANWNVLMWSGTQTPTENMPGKIDLLDYVQSFYYPQDGGDVTSSLTADINGVSDPYRYTYNNFGTYGNPYTDKPVYEKPIYKFEIVGNVTQGSNAINPARTHEYLTLEGSVLKVRPDKIKSARDTQHIIRVTQINSKTVERQPIGYLVVKISEDQASAFKDVKHTFDGFKPFMLTCAGGDLNPDKSHAPEMNPADVDVLVDKINQIGSTADFFRSPYAQGGKNLLTIPQNANFKITEKKFAAAAYNHVNDAEFNNQSRINVTADDAFKHITIKAVESLNAYIITTDKTAPAGKYEVTFKIRNISGASGVSMSGPDLYITFKFEINTPQIKVTRDGHNWRGNDLMVQFAQYNNTIGYKFLSDDSYAADLTQAYKLVSGTKQIEFTATPQQIGSCDAYSMFKPRFEFVTDNNLLAAQSHLFKFERDNQGYLTIIKYKDQIAARIVKDADQIYRLRIMFGYAGDALYNYLVGGRPVGQEIGLKVRLVTDINEAKFMPSTPAADVVNNYMFVDQFIVKPVRALHFKFTPVFLKDQQIESTWTFDFETVDRINHIYRGVFSRWAEAGQENKDTDYLVTVHNTLGKWFGLRTPVELPCFKHDGSVYVDYNFIEMSEDGGVNWKSVPMDMRINGPHGNRYFSIERRGFGLYKALWQGDVNPITHDFMFRVPVLNEDSFTNLGVYGIRGVMADLNVKKGEKPVVSFRKDPSAAPSRNGESIVEPVSYATFIVKKVDL